MSAKPKPAPVRKPRSKRPAMLEPHLSAESVAKLLDCTPDHLRRMRATSTDEAPRGPRWVVTADGTIRYPESALRAYLGHEVSK